VSGDRGRPLETLVLDLVDVERGYRDELAAIHARLDQIEGRTGFLSISEFAERADCAPNTVRSAIENDLIRVVVLGPRTMVIPESELTGRYLSEYDTRPRLRLVPASGHEQGPAPPAA
jgi:hypothetical protein